MNANPKFLNATAHVDDAAVKPLPNSRKIHVEGSRPDIRVPMREITQSDTPIQFGAPAPGGAPARSEPNPPIFVYDTSGPYTDPSVNIDIRSGLAPLRQKWIEAPNASPWCCRVINAGSSSSRWFSRIAMNSISGVMMPRRA